MADFFLRSVTRQLVSVKSSNGGAVKGELEGAGATQIHLRGGLAWAAPKKEREMVMKRRETAHVDGEKERPPTVLCQAPDHGPLGLLVLQPLP